MMRKVGTAESSQLAAKSYGSDSMNEKAVETLVQFAYDQHIIPRKFSVEELFAPNTLTLT